MTANQMAAPASPAQSGYSTTRRPMEGTEVDRLVRLHNGFRTAIIVMAIITIVLAVVNFLVDECGLLVPTGILALLCLVMPVTLLKRRRDGLRALEDGSIVEISGTVMSTGMGGGRRFIIGPISFPPSPELGGRIAEGSPARLEFVPFLNVAVSLNGQPMSRILMVTVPKGFMESLPALEWPAPGDAGQAPPVVAPQAPAKVEAPAVQVTPPIADVPAPRPSETPATPSPQRAPTSLGGSFKPPQ